MIIAVIFFLVEHRTGIAEVMGSNPVEALIFSRLLLSNCLNWKFTAMIILNFEKLEHVQLWWSVFSCRQGHICILRGFLVWEMSIFLSKLFLLSGNTNLVSMKTSQITQSRDQINSNYIQYQSHIERGDNWRRTPKRCGPPKPPDKKGMFKKQVKGTRKKLRRVVCNVRSNEPGHRKTSFKRLCNIK